MSKSGSCMLKLKEKSNRARQSELLEFLLALVVKSPQMDKLSSTTTGNSTMAMSSALESLNSTPNSINAELGYPKMGCC